MRGVSIVEPGKVVLTGRECGVPGTGQVRIRLLQGGLCGSDLSAFLGTSPMVSYPRVVGHEVIGTVVESGDGTSEWMGKTVAVEPYMQCGQCYACRTGKYNCCTSLKVMGVHIDGGLQDEFLAPVHKLIEVPRGMDLDTATLVEPLTISTHAVDRVGVQPGEKVLIFGAGAIGLLALQVIRHYGASGLVVDVRDDRLAKALRLGAEQVVNLSGWQGPGTSPALLDSVRDWTGGDGAHVVIEASGAPASNAAALDCLAHGGRIALVGWNKGPITVDTVLLMRKEATISGSRNSAGIFPKAFEILAGGAIDVEEFITHKLSLEKAAEGLAIMQDNSSGVVKVILTA